VIGGLKNPADGFFLINELRSPRKQQRYPQPLIDAYQTAISAIAKTIQMPIRYAGPGHWSVFEKPQSYNQIAARTVAVPRTRVQARCLIIPFDLWTTFRQMSLWVEALCIHEWCLFSERVSHEDRGYIYGLLTSRPDNRRPLTWASSQLLKSLQLQSLLTQTGRETAGSGLNKGLLALHVSYASIRPHWDEIPEVRAK
jgi:hypothetical protein